MSQYPITTDRGAYDHYQECYDNVEYMKISGWIETLVGKGEKHIIIMNLMIDACMEQSGDKYHRGKTSSFLQWVSWAFRGLTVMAIRDYVLSFGNCEWQTLTITVKGKSRG